VMSRTLDIETTGECLFLDNHFCNVLRRDALKKTEHQLGKYKRYGGVLGDSDHIPVRCVGLDGQKCPLNQEGFLKIKKKDKKDE
jgi:hypothetical protein